MFINVATQVAILLILISLGFIAAKTRLLNDTGVKNMTDFVLMLVTPAVIIKSFIREFNTSLFKNLIISFLITAIAHVFFILAGKLLLRSKNVSRQKVLQFSVIFSNCGYMSIPLLQAILGDDGVFYGSSYIAIFNVFVWSYGLYLMSGDKKNINIKKLTLNPGIIGFTISIIIFLCSIPIPKIIYEPIAHIAALNTPLPMVIIGYHLASSNLLKGLKDIKCIIAILLKLFVLPLVVLFVMYLCGIRGTILLALTICSCAPTAAITTMFSTKYGADTELSVTLVSLSTILSLVSMPLIVTLAQYLA